MTIIRKTNSVLDEQHKKHLNLMKNTESVSFNSYKKEKPFNSIQEQEIKLVKMGKEKIEKLGPNSGIFQNNLKFEYIL